MAATIIFFFAWLAVGFAEGNGEGNSDLDILQNLTDDGKGKVLQSLESIDNTSNEFEKFIGERLDCLLWECTVQNQNLNKTVMKAVSKGMSKNKQFANFQCISNTSQVTINELDVIKTQIPVNSQSIKQKGLKEITSFKLTLTGFYSYVQELYDNKKEEMTKENKEDKRKKILEEVTQKMTLLKSLLEAVNSYAKTVKFKIIEEYINFAFATENDLKSVQREGANKVLKCVA